MHRSLGPGPQMLFRRKWRKLDTLLSFFHIVGQYSLHRYFKWDFFFNGSGFREKFSRIAQFSKSLQLGSKIELNTKGLTFEFFVRLWLVFLSSYPHGQKIARFAQLWFSFGGMKKFGWLVWEVFWSVLCSCPYFLTIGVSNNNWWASSTQSNLFPMFIRLQAFNSQSSDESILWLLLKVLYSFFMVFSMSISFDVLLRFTQKLFFEV